MCKDNPDCISCLTEKIEKLTLAMDDLSNKINNLDLMLNNHSGLIVRVSHLEKLVTTSQWVAGILFTSVIGIVLKLVFKV